jgi:hypothetical protein
LYKKDEPKRDGIHLLKEWMNGIRVTHSLPTFTYVIVKTTNQPTNQTNKKGPKTNTRTHDRRGDHHGQPPVEVIHQRLDLRPVNDGGDGGGGGVGVV